MSAARRRADRTYRQRLVACGMCVRGCGRLSKPDALRCEHCTKAAAEAQWRRRQTDTRKPRGPARKVRPVNLTTDELIEAHIRLARGLAGRVAARFGIADPADLIGDALYGLVVAGRTYDASYGVPFGAWATPRIRGAVFDGLRRWWQASRGQTDAAAA